MNFQTRPDGWPLCPRCGLNELFSLPHAPTIGRPEDAPPLVSLGETNSGLLDLLDHFRLGFRCYSCGWTSAALPPEAWKLILGVVENYLGINAARRPSISALIRIGKLAQTDPIIFNFHKQFQMGNIGWEEMLISIIEMMLTQSVSMAELITLLMTRLSPDQFVGLVEGKWQVK
jgi:hypothetical protein